MSAAVIPEPIAQFQFQLDEIRSIQPLGLDETEPVVTTKV